MRSIRTASTTPQSSSHACGRIEPWTFRPAPTRHHRVEKRLPRSKAWSQWCCTSPRRTRLKAPPRQELDDDSPSSRHRLGSGKGAEVVSAANSRSIAVDYAVPRECRHRPREAPMLLQHGTSRDIECVPIHDRQWSYEIRLNLGVTKLDKSCTPSFTAYEFYGTRSCSRQRLLPRESLNALDLAGRFHPSARVDASGPASGLALRLASCRRMSGNGAHRDRAGLHDVFDRAGIS